MKPTVIVYYTNSRKRVIEYGSRINGKFYNPDRIIYAWLKDFKNKNDGFDLYHIENLTKVKLEELVKSENIFEIISSHSNSLNLAKTSDKKYVLSIDQDSDLGYNAPTSIEFCPNFAGWLSYGLYTGEIKKAGLIGPNHCIWAYEFPWTVSIDNLENGKAAFLPSREIKISPYDNLTERFLQRYKSDSIGKGWEIKGKKFCFKDSYKTMKPIDFANKFLKEVNPEEALLTICSDSNKVIKQSDLLEIIKTCKNSGVKNINYAVESKVNNPMVELIGKIIQTIIIK